MSANGAAARPRELPSRADCRYVSHRYITHLVTDSALMKLRIPLASFDLMSKIHHHLHHDDFIVSLP
eukprot:498925-Pleurochrysis_carterae.AAC.6